jgi:hypothetical protein
MNIFNLTLAELRFFRCLKAVNSNSLWGAAIQTAMKEPTEDNVRRLAVQLKSQAVDNEPMIKQILGEDCFDTLMKLP